MSEMTSAIGGPIACAAALVCAACAGKVFESDDISIDGSYPAAGEGVAYALPKQYYEVSISRSLDDKNQLQLTFSATSPATAVADPDHVYRLRYKRSAGTTSDVKVEVNSAGLLDKITTTTADATPKAVADLAKFLVSAATSGLSATFDAAGFAPAPKTEPQLFSINAIIDPSDEGKPGSTVDMLKAELKKFNVSFDSIRQFELEAPRRSYGEYPPQAAGPPIQNYKAFCAEAVCFRSPLPYLLIVKDPQGAREQAWLIVTAPNEAPVTGIEVWRRAFVENKYVLDFDQGMLVSAQYVDPSITGAVVQAPLNLAKGIAAVPSALFKFTLATETDKAELEAQKAVVDAQKQLAESQKLLFDAQKALKDATEPKKN